VDNFANMSCDDIIMIYTLSLLKLIKRVNN